MPQLNTTSTADISFMLLIITRVKALMEHPFGDKVELNLPLRADADSGDSYQEAK